MRYPVIVAISLSLHIFSQPGLARTWLILPDGTGDAPSIQAGIDSAATSDTLLLEDGIFSGTGNRDMDYNGKAIVIRSMNGDPENCVIDCELLGSGFQFIRGEGPTSVLQGVQITNGYRGEGGGAVYCNANPLFENCIFSDCSTGLIGRAPVACDKSPIFENCIFRGNTGLQGGAVSCYGDNGVCTPQFNQCRFEYNSAFTSDSSDGSGGAVYCSNANPTFDSCEFFYNSCADQGGAFACKDNSSPLLLNCLFEGNSGRHGGGFSSYGGGHPVLQNCTFRSNSADDVGGGVIFNGTAYPEVKYCVFDGNQASRGGAIGFFHISGPTYFENVTGYGNQASLAGGCIYAKDSSPTLKNSIFAFSTDGEAVFCQPDGEITLKCCDLFGNAEGDWVGCIAGQEDLNGNLSLNPRFCNAGERDFGLLLSSPCIDAIGCELIGAEGEGCVDVITDVRSSEEASPSGFSLWPNEPNPFNPLTTLRFVVPTVSLVRLTIHDVTGRRIATLVEGYLEAGVLSRTWNGRDGRGLEVRSGIYFARLEAGDFTATRKMVLLR